MSGAGRCDIVFSTNRFNLSEPREYFINDCCYGDDAARWIVARLRLRGLTVTEPDQEDWGWYFDAQFNQADYFVGVGGNADDAAASGNRGEWRLMIQKHRTLWERISGRNQLSEHDEFLAILKHIVVSEPDLRLVAVE
jgi:hypothetical protein